MSDTEPIDPGAKVNPATGMYGCSLYPIYPEPQSPADAEPLDLAAIEARWEAAVTMRGAIASGRDVPALIAEVRRLREAMQLALDDMEGYGSDILRKALQPEEGDA